MFRCKADVKLVRFFFISLLLVAAYEETQLVFQRNRQWNRQWQSVVAALSESTYLLTYGALAAATAGLGTEPGAGTPRVQHRYKPGAGTPLASFCTAGD